MGYRYNVADTGTPDVLLPDGFKQTSLYRGIPLFSHNTLGVALSVDDISPEQRLYPDAYRFTLYAFNGYGAPIPGDPVVETDNFDEVLHVVGAIQRPAALDGAQRVK